MESHHLPRRGPATPCIVQKVEVPSVVGNKNATLLSSGEKLLGVLGTLIMQLSGGNDIMTLMTQ